tara:strand:+ start:1889 stop:2620 length:732 start_codon:yes stop_codon:yes gene_type:complete
MSISALIRRMIIINNQSGHYMKSRVLLYHDLHDNTRYTNMSTSLNLFKIHVEIIRSMGFCIVSEITKEEGQIQITFDDGFKGLFENIDIINKLNIPIKLFVISSFIGRNSYLNKNQLISLSKNSLIKIGSHTHTHRRLTTLSQDIIKYELVYSKSLLEDIVDYSIDDLCYPEGKFNKKVISISNDVGYVNQYSLIPGPFFLEVFKNVRRRSLVQHTIDKELKAILRGGDDLLDTWYMKKHYKL